MIRRVQDENAVYLTFDDGPDEAGTPAVLDILKRHDARATFFLIARKLAGREALLRRVLEDGHAIGNHSYDHLYRHFFSGRRHLRSWLESADAEFDRFVVRDQLVGFRPPAGILTPALLRVLRERREPLVLWNERFYDAVFKWTPAKARRSVESLDGGSIVLLHDRQAPQRLEEFCRTLDLYLGELRARGFALRALRREQLL